MMVPEGKEFRSISYAELENRVRQMCAALKEKGLKRGDRVALQAENCMEWALVDWGCQCLGIALVPIYPTLPTDQTEYIVRDSGANLIVSSTPEQQAKVAAIDAQKVLLPDLAAHAQKLDMPVAEWEAEIDATGREDLCTIIYTSGTTGNPKGAMLPHRVGMFVSFHAKAAINVDENDVFLTFLPMSHVYERVAGQWFPIYLGGTVAFSKSLATLANDMQTVKPTVLLCVPRFLEATMDKILDGVKKAPPLRQKLFHLALEQGKKRVAGKPAPLAGLLDKLVGAKIRERTGGRIRYFVSGGAALPPHVAEFYMAFNMIILQGYGLTETGGGSYLNRPGTNKYWTVGEALGVETKIAEDGEILLRSDANLLGYYNLPEETAAAIDSEGWFHTGDIGEFEGPHLKITDRKKDLLVLANGKNIAPQQIENKIKESNLIQEVVLFGDGNEYVYGLLIPNFERVREQLSLTEEDNHKLIEMDSVKALIKGELDRVNKTLADFEKVKKHALVDAAFSIETGELTPSLKVKRKVVKEKFADVLATLVR
jgi:long-chain acyl-CoA synthetase